MAQNKILILDFGGQYTQLIFFQAEDGIRD